MKYTVLLIALLSASYAAEPEQFWMALAGTGSVDTGSTIDGGGGWVTLPALSNAAVIRYNIVAVDGLFAPLTPTSWPALIVRYRVTGAARVVARVKRVSIADGGSPQTVITFDSDLHPPTSAVTRSIGNCGNFSDFDFSQYAYFVEVELTRSAPGAAAGLALVGMSRYGVCLP